MSTFNLRARHKESGTLHTVTAMDDYYGRHNYGYKIHETGDIYEEYWFNKYFERVEDQVQLVPSDRLDYCVACDAEHGFECPQDKIERPEKKDTNPKDSVGIRKAPMSTVPTRFVLGVGLAMMEGARKYGRHNYRVAGIRLSVYYDAFMRHMMAWYEGEDIDPDSGLSHLYKAGACLAIIDDALANGMCTDDRPPKMKNVKWVKGMNDLAGVVIEKYPECVEPYTELKTATG